MPPRHLILVGGGHSHALVLKAFGDRPEPDLLRPTVVSPNRFTTYSGMVPGVITGQYALREAQIDIEQLAQRAGGTFVPARAVRVDAARRAVELSDGSRLTYDLVSFDIGAQSARSADIAAHAPVIALKPIEDAIAAIDAFVASADAGDRRIVVVGAGAGGCEVALALAARLRGQAGTSIVVCDDDRHPVAERGPRTSRLVERAFADAGIAFLGGAAVARVTATAVHLSSGRELPAALIVWATGAGAPPLFTASGLPTDQRGFLLVGADLRSPVWPQIFAAGDCATPIPHRSLPKAGVYAVRQAPVLTRNLRAAAAGAALQAYHPQRLFLSLLNTADGRAILSYGPLAARGGWAWWLKDRIDRSFVNQFTTKTPRHQE